VRSVVESLDVIEHNATFRELVGVNRLRRLAIIIVNSRANPPNDWDQSVSGPGPFAQLMQATGVPIARYSYDQIELIRDMVDRWGLLRDRSPPRGSKAGRPSRRSSSCRDRVLSDRRELRAHRRFRAKTPLSRACRRASCCRMPTSTRCARSRAKLLRENKVYRQLVQDLGGTPAP
jgi:hypothetical protein